jgi:hypothetical protein
MNRSRSCELALDVEGWQDGSMARSKRTPERSKLVRARAEAFARRQRSGAEGEDKGEKEADKEKAEKEKRSEEETKPEVKPGEGKRADTEPMARPDTSELPEIEPPAPRDEPWPDATPQPMKPVEAGEAVRGPRTMTVAMPATADLGRPPEMPHTTAPPPLALGEVEDPTHMPGPKDVPAGDPDDPAPPPGRVPPGDSRSLRRQNEFALVYRVGTCVITRTGTLGTRGQWRVVEYPTSASASSSYAKECSRFVSEGFSDYRD